MAPDRDRLTLHDHTIVNLDSARAADVGWFGDRECAPRTQFPSTGGTLAVPDRPGHKANPHQLGAPARTIGPGHAKATQRFFMTSVRRSPRCGGPSRHLRHIVRAEHRCRPDTYRQVSRTSGRWPLPVESYAA